MTSLAFRGNLEASENVKQFSGRRCINVESCNRDGTPKRTPVQSVEAHGIIYFPTYPGTLKIRRIKPNPGARVALRDRNGRVTGTWFDGDAQIGREMN